MSKIEETIKKIAAGTSKETSPTSSSTDAKMAKTSGLPGSPDCPICNGVGYLRRDLPIEHPDFGKLEICSCRQGQVDQAIRQRLYSLSNLEQLSHLTFENFKPRGQFGLNPLQASSLEIAYNHAQRFAQTLEGWLVLEGKYGCGKTHLAAAIANFAVSLGVPTLFLTVPDLLDSLRFAFQSPEITFEDRLEEVRTAGLLVLDDFGTQNATSWAQEKLFQIVNYRYINQLPMVVTTNLPLDQIEGRIRSRLEDPQLVTVLRIMAPDFRNPTDAAGHSVMSSLDLLGNQKFATFSMRQDENLPTEELKNLEKAFQTAREFADDPQGWLVFMGEHGAGKTHLAASIANYLTDQGVPNIFVVVPDLLDHLRATFNPNSTVSYDQLFDEVRTTKVLILDDLGTESMTPWVREKLYQLFNYRYNSHLATIITTSDSFDKMDTRLRSRMLDKRICTIFAITAPSYRGISGPEKRTRAKRRSTSRR
jgi:DNA replication protein DnaC